MTLIPITNDLYDISDRLRSVNDDYRLIFDAERKRYAVYSRTRGTLCFDVPFDELDARTVEYAQKTRVQNAREIFREVEEHNARLERQASSAMSACKKEFL